MEPIRILQVVPAMNTGGMETFIMNLYRAMDREKVQFDFLYHYDMPCFYDEEILRLGGRITKLTVRQDNNLPKYLHQLNEFFARHTEYRVIHGHYSGFGMFYNAAAKKNGITVRAGHSHNTNYEHNLVGWLDRAMSFFFTYGLTDRFACGQEVGKSAVPGQALPFPAQRRGCGGLWPGRSPAGGRAQAAGRAGRRPPLWAHRALLPAEKTTVTCWTSSSRS